MMGVVLGCRRAHVRAPAADLKEALAHSRCVLPRPPPKPWIRIQNGGALGGNRTLCLAVRSPTGAVQDGPDGARRCLRVFGGELENPQHARVIRGIFGDPSSRLPANVV